MTHYLKKPTSTIDDWLPSREESERIDNERRAALPEIVAWLEWQYSKVAVRSAKMKAIIFFEEDIFCPFDWKYVYDPILIGDLRTVMAERGWRFEKYDTLVVLTPL